MNRGRPYADTAQHDALVAKLARDNRRLRAQRDSACAAESAAVAERDAAQASADDYGSRWADFQSDCASDPTLYPGGVFDAEEYGRREAAWRSENEAP